jgi:twitching motility protein PilI
MARRTSLREFQENLARRLGEAKTADHRSLLGFQVGDDNWLIDLADSGEILPPPPFVPVPLTRPWFRGLANVRGTLHGVVDFASLHDKAPIMPTGQARLLLVGARQSIRSALLVSRTAGLRSQDDFDAAPLPDGEHPWVGAHLHDTQGRLWRKLDVGRLLAHSDFLDAGIA